MHLLFRFGSVPSWLYCSPIQSEEFNANSHQTKFVTDRDSDPHYFFPAESDNLNKVPHLRNVNFGN